jgi:hypothetical protein
LNGFGAPDPARETVELVAAPASTPGIIDIAAAAAVPFTNSRLCMSSVLGLVSHAVRRRSADHTQDGDPSSTMNRG